VLAGLYARARTFAYVPLIEGFGIPPMEAMAAGVPVVSSTGTPSVAAAGTASASGASGTVGTAEPVAAVVDPLDVEAIAAALVSVSTDTARRTALVAAGAALVTNRTWRRAADEHVELWRSLVLHRGGR
jgi:glycosyltransferase involved in cell wall biosynthesis